MSLGTATPLGVSAPLTLADRESSWRALSRGTDAPVAS